MLSATDHNYGITALHNYGFTVRLLPEKLENQNPLSAKIEIFKIKTLPPYSVAKLTRVPSGTLYLTQRVYNSITQPIT